LLIIGIMIREKILYSVGANGLNYNGQLVELCVIGLFDTESANWSYYVCSLITAAKGKMFTLDMHKYELPYSISNIQNYSRRFKTIETGKEVINTFRDKWETGSNEPKQEVRDNKITDILKEEEK
jgi:hypothetical protein